MQILLQDIKKLETEALIVGFFEDVRPLKGLAGELDWLLCGALSSLLLNKKLRGSLGEVALLTSQGKIPTQKIFMVGLGPKKSFSLSTMRSAARAASSSAFGAGITKAAIEYFQPPDMLSEEGVSAFSEGLSQGAEERSLDVTMIVSDAAAYKKIAPLVTQKLPKSIYRRGRGEGN
jgi:hypothetical protein